MRYFRTLPDSMGEVRTAARRAQALLGDDLGVEAELDDSGVPRIRAEGKGKVVMGTGEGKEVGREKQGVGVVATA